MHSSKITGRHGGAYDNDSFKSLDAEGQQMISHSKWEK